MRTGEYSANAGISMIPAHFFYTYIEYWEMNQGGVILPSTGYIQVHAYTSNARIPLQGAAVTIARQDGSAIAMRLTNRSGTFDSPVEISVPDRSASQSPNTGIIPFTDVTLYARLKDFETIEIENLQVFPSTITVQNLAMIPLSELPDSYNKIEIFDTPPQNL